MRLLLVAAFALSACAQTTATYPPNIFAPVGVSRSTLTDTCSGDVFELNGKTVEVGDAPSAQVVAQLDPVLLQRIEDLLRKGPNDLSPIDGFIRQYFAVTVDGKNLILVNVAWPYDSSFNDRAPNTLIDVCDGGMSFWHGVFDPSNSRLLKLVHNGVA